MVKFLKIYNTRNPEREFGNGGIDVFVPYYSDEFIKALLDKNPNLDYSLFGFTVYPGQSVLIPTGLKTRFSAPNIALEATNKSGIATKKNLIFGATLVDYSYTGVIHAHLINVGTTPQTILFGEKIIQFVPRIIDIEEHEIVENMSSEEFYKDFVTTRGNGAFGSTGA